jgi:hypothetical protein
MPTYIAYDDDGKIIASINCPASSYDLRPPGEHWLEHDLVDDTEFYIVGGVVTTRPLLPAVVDKTTVIADDTDVMTISGLPDPCEVRVGTEAFTAVGGSAEISFDLPGSHTIRISHFPYQDWEVDVDAV